MSQNTAVPVARSSDQIAPETRDQLITKHLGLVHHMARQISRRLAVQIDFDELVSAGTLGLMNAVDSFDSGRGVAFSTYAAPRIRGAILDELRRQDHAPRSMRRKIRDISAAREALSRSEGYSPSDQEMADHLQIDLETYWRWQAEVEGSFILGLDQPLDGDGRSSATASLSIAGATGEMIEQDINHREEVSILREAIMQLKEQERLVLSLYYFEELKLHEIGTIIELTESRVSQIRSRAIAKLRNRLPGLQQAA